MPQKRTEVVAARWALRLAAEGLSSNGNASRSGVIEMERQKVPWQKEV